MNFTKHILACAGALLLASSAQAGVAVTADVGTTGGGVALVVPMETYLNGRFGVHYLSKSTQETAVSVDYDVKAKLLNGDVLFDWFIADGTQWRLTLGGVYNGNELKATAKPGADGKYFINGHSYTAADVGSLKGVIDFRKAAPYVGIGYGNPLATSSSKWRLMADFGLIFQGRPEANLVSLGCVTSQTVCRALATDVAADKERFRNEIDTRQIFPVARIGIAYAF